MRTMFRESPASCGTRSQPHSRSDAPSRRSIVLAAGVCIASSSACWFGDAGATEPPGGFAPVSIAFTTRIVAQTANAINVQLGYLRANQASVLLVDSTAKIRQSSTGSFGWSGVRGFPFDVDLTRCLIDPAHVPSGPSCTLLVVIQLLSDGQPVSIIRPFQLVVTPGTTNTAAPIVELAEVATVTPASVTSLGVAVNGTIALTARVEDVRGEPILDARVQWRTSDGAIARVDDAGIVTGLSPGTVAVTATVAGRSGSIAVVVGGAGSGSR